MCQDKGRFGYTAEHGAGNGAAPPPLDASDAGVPASTPARTVTQPGGEPPGKKEIRQ
jgi:hypothetical protein